MNQHLIGFRLFLHDTALDSLARVSNEQVSSVGNGFHHGNGSRSGRRVKAGKKDSAWYVCEVCVGMCELLKTIDVLMLTVSMMNS